MRRQLHVIPLSTWRHFYAQEIARDILLHFTFIHLVKSQTSICNW